MQEYKDNLTWAAKPDIFAKAKDLRNDMTETERIMWRRLRGRKLNGLKFRRQHPIDISIADFYCHEKKLIVEPDGGIHDTNEQKDYDDGRSFELEEKGFKILRFRNEEVTNGIDQVLIKIIEACK